MNLPMIVINVIAVMVIILGCLTTILLLLMTIYLIHKKILDFIFNLSSNKLIFKEFRKYYFNGIRSGDIEPTPIMKWILEKEIRRSRR